MLIKSITDLKKYVAVVGTLNIEVLEPYINDAQEKYLRKHIGAELLGLIDTWYNDTTPETNADYTALLPYLQNPLSKLAMYLAAPSLDLKITDSGFAVVSTQQLAPASDKRVAALREAMLMQGYDSIDALLTFLEENADSYPEWVETEGYTTSYSTFVRNTDQFDKIINIGGSRLKFQELRPVMDNVDLLQIEPVISKALADAMREELKNDAMSDENLVIYPLLQRAEANLAAADAGMGEKFRNIGLAFLAEVKKVLDAYPTDLAKYALYKASTSFDAARTTYEGYENKEENKTFTFGG
jgi:hypothetical protein